MLKKSECLGTYVPSFFFIQLNTNESLIEIDKCTKTTLSTYFHEYIHFLQDLFTLYGLRNINHTVYNVYAINKESLSKGETNYPVTISDNEVLKQIDLFGIYYGTDFLSYEPFQIIDYSTEPNGLVPGFEYVENIEIKTISSSVGIDSFYFGAYVILESLAYLIEKSIFGISSSPIFPYSIVDLIIDELFHDLNLVPEMRIALCEESLNSGHPGKTFFTILERMRTNKLCFSSPKEFHDFCHLQFFLQDDKGVKFSISFALESETNHSQSNLKLYFRDETIIKINSWIDFVFNKVKKYRKQDFHFYELFGNRKLLVEIINELGTPLIGDSNSNYYFMNSKIDQSNCDISIFLAIRELMYISVGKQKHCALKSRCLVTDPSLVTLYCDTAPEENRKNKAKCDLTALMYLWGLK
jgi:hypothetical protein